MNQPSPDSQKTHSSVPIQAGTLSVVDQLAEDVLQILSSESESKREILLSFRDLPTRIETLKEQSRYDYSDYESRLLATDKVLWQAYLRLLDDPCIAPAIRPIMNFFHEDPIIRNNPMIEAIFLKKLYERHFKDLVHEHLNEWEFQISEKSGKLVDVKDSMWEYIAEIDRIGKEWIRNLNASSRTLFNKYDPAELDKFIQALKRAKIFELNLSSVFLDQLKPGEFAKIIGEFWRAGITRLHLYGSYLSRLKSEGVVDLVRTAGENGIAWLDIGGNSLWEKFKPQQMTDIVQIAGESGIRHLALRSNDIWFFLKAQGTIKFVQIAGESGILSLDLGMNRLCDYMNEDEMIELVRTAGECGIRNLILFMSLFWYRFTVDQMANIVGAAGGIRWLDISFNNLWNTHDVRALIVLTKRAGESGIRYFNVSDNQLKNLNSLGKIAIIESARESWIMTLEHGWDLSEAEKKPKSPNSIRSILSVFGYNSTDVVKSKR